MSTNYYIGADHIGKFSRAGSACDTCGVAEVVNSAEMFSHDAVGEHGDACPMCGCQWNSFAAVFTWTALKHKWEIEMAAAPPSLLAPIVDEYGTAYTAAEFLALLPRVTIHRLLSTEFS